MECWDEVWWDNRSVNGKMKSKHSGMLSTKAMEKGAGWQRWNLNTVECWECVNFITEIGNYRWNLNTVECWGSAIRQYNKINSDEI